MGKYSTKKTDEDGNVTYEASDGSVFKSSGAAHKHSVKLEDAAFEAEQAAKAEEKEPSTPGVEGQTGSKTPIEKEENETSFQSWDWGEDDEDENEIVVPSILKKIRPAAPEGRSRKTKKALAAERDVNLAVLQTGYKLGDVVLTRYKRMMLSDKKAEPITHAQEDYEWISDVTNEALTHNGVSIGAAIGPTQVALIANGYWFGSEVYKVNAESDKSPFKGRFGGGIKRLLKRVPFIGRRIRRAEQAKMEVFENDEYAG
jgi:hypothetical protein